MFMLSVLGRICIQYVFNKAHYSYIKVRSGRQEKRTASILQILKGLRKQVCYLSTLAEETTGTGMLLYQCAGGNFPKRDEQLRYLGVFLATATVMTQQYFRIRPIRQFCV